jgi:IS605 OrfB family transposase
MVTAEPVQGALLETARAFAVACNAILVESKKLKTSNKVKLQHAAYHNTRAQTGLSANLVIRAIARVAAAVKVAGKRKKVVKEFKPTSIDYDQRIFAYREKEESVSLSTLRGRLHIPLSLGDYQRKALQGKNPTFATVVLHGKTWFIHIVIDEERPNSKTDPEKCLGVDLGINNIAVLSTGTSFSGKALQSYKEKCGRVRASLQSKRTKGSKKVLRRLSGRERRFIRDANHRVSKQIVAEALSGGYGVIRLERLRNIRVRTKSWNKHLNRMISGRSFGQLQDFTRYKAEREGINTEEINPAYSSQTCHVCFSRGLRNGKTFSCPTCGLVTDADLNAAKVIAAGGASVNTPKSDKRASA